MRPDKHKKKNHAAYAKRAAQKKVKNETHVDNATSRGKAKVRPNVRTNCNPPAEDRVGDVESKHIQLHDSLRPHTTSSSPSSSSNSSASTDNSTLFSRRKIESNWQQYDELPEEEEIVSHRGADFMLLLSQTAGSQFRFKDEESIDEDSSQEDPSSFISFDCNELAKKLQTISLPERLEISRTVFDLETLDILDQDAATSENLANNQINVCADLSITASDNQVMITPVDHDLEDILTRSQTDETVLNQPLKVDEGGRHNSLDVRLQASSASCEEEREKKNMFTKGFHSKKAEQQASSNPEPASDSHSKDHDGDEDGELDFLLSLSAPPGNESHQSNLNVRKEEVSSPLEEPLKTEENCLHQFKSTASPETPQTSVAAAAAPAAPSDVQTESLDDWLDSILDD